EAHIVCRFQVVFIPRQSRLSHSSAPGFSRFYPPLQPIQQLQQAFLNPCVSCRMNTTDRMCAQLPQCMQRRGRASMIEHDAFIGAAVRWQRPLAALIAIAAATLCASLALAQSAPATEQSAESAVQEVVVTGSRIA